MKLVCSQTELNSSLQLVSRAIAGRPTHPVLANVLVTADAAAGRISLTGFDLSLGIQTSFAAVVEGSGAITLPAKLLADIVSRLPPDGPITLSCPEGEEQVELTALSGSYQMRGMTAEDFPELPLAQNGRPILLSGAALVEGLRSTLFASSSDEAKQILTGIHLKVEEGGLEFAATDGHRLAVRRNQAGGEQGAEPFAVTVPARSLRELERLLSARPSEESISLFCDRGQVVFLWADQVLTSRTLDGTYPNYGQLIPDSFVRSLSIERKPLLAALERVAVLADQHNNVVKFSANPSTSQLLLSADAQDVGSGSEALTIRMEGEAIELAFNVRYVLEGLKSMAAQEVCLRLNTSTSPAILHGEAEEDSFTYLVMPVQIRS
ncbi:DNA polymerase III subunit beta [Synechococcus sp. UW140]|uniref:DNA polymerase III subunit beta n=3 Tax=unclassified Synechococcus TaxID=2626047 RepID=UPI001A3357CC|nr:DNA polymerase III subunit beta [Synechococcus sp. UW140]MBJ7363342.1 DNA polymerase III subunit beta [Synechococcus sp. SupBloom_Metag_053]